MKKNGFKLLGNTKPNYSYIIKHKREHRFKYRKDILIKAGYNKDLTENEIMIQRKINKIYDCGNKKWLLRLK